MTMADKNSDRRAKAEAARNAANAGEKKRERMTRIIGAVVVVVVVLGIIGIAVIAKNSSSDSSGGGSSASADPNAPVPTGAFNKDNKFAYGVSLNPNDTAVPVLEIWEDFQCPACQALEKANGAGIEKLAADGKVQLIWRPTTFLDRNLKNDSSVRAAAAWGCAIDAGKTQEFHNAVYANPPATEGDGFTDAQLQSFAATAGITGAALDTFNSCLAAGTYQPWALNSTQVFYDANIPGTPLVKINGTEIDPSVAADPAKLEQAVAAATK
jgi:protein-disulfide isomerase